MMTESTYYFWKPGVLKNWLTGTVQGENKKSLYCSKTGSVPELVGIHIVTIYNSNVWDALLFGQGAITSTRSNKLYMEAKRYTYGMLQAVPKNTFELVSLDLFVSSIFGEDECKLLVDFMVEKQAPIKLKFGSFMNSSFLGQKLFMRLILSPELVRLNLECVDKLTLREQLYVLKKCALKKNLHLYIKLVTFQSAFCAITGYDNGESFFMSHFIFFKGLDNGVLYLDCAQGFKLDVHGSAPFWHPTKLWVKRMVSKSIAIGDYKFSCAVSNLPGSVFSEITRFSDPLMKKFLLYFRLW